MKIIHCISGKLGDNLFTKVLKASFNSNNRQMDCCRNRKTWFAKKE